MSFSEDEIEYLRSQPLARLATVSPEGQPDVAPLAFEWDGTFFWVGGTGSAVAQTRKFRNVEAGNDKVALVVDDLVALDPFIARSVRIYGRARGPIERTGLVGPGTYLQITPVVSWSWNIAGKPLAAGDLWYVPRRIVHESPAAHDPS